MLAVVEAESIAGNNIADLQHLKRETLKYKSHHIIKYKIPEALEDDAYLQFSKIERAMISGELTQA